MRSKAGASGRNRNRTGWVWALPILICARLTRLQPLTRNSFWRKLPPGPQEFQLRLKCQITALGWGLQAALLSSDVVLPRTLHLRDIICLPNEDAPLFEIMKDFYQKGHRRDSNPGPSGWDPKPTRALTNRPLRLPLFIDLDQTNYTPGLQLLLRDPFFKFQISLLSSAIKNKG